MTALGAVITPLLVLAILRWADPEEPARNAFLAVAGGAGVAVTGMPADTWQVPFRVIGSIGFLWIVLWFVTVPRQAFAPPDEGKAGTAADARFVAVFLDRRFWVLFAMTVAINITWHGYRTWLPLYLQRQRGFTEAEMSWFLTAYYLAADVGSWTVGGVTLILARRGMTVHGSRKTAYAACAGLTLMSLLVPFLPNGLPLQAALLMLAFGALGLFPTYFALSQELSGRHQGKVTGTLGMCAHFSLFLIYPVEGAIVEWAKPSPVAFGLVWYEPVLGLVGLVPLLAFLFLLWQWPRGE
jgi:ACS family hexuronate transporter-like MFS transporter